ncbi:MAG TPA: hypothetical protein VGJ60_07420 [Chloroflexota bacterium]|jgi:hypothetical protein
MTEVATALRDIEQALILLAHHVSRVAILDYDARDELDRALNDVSSSVRAVREEVRP